jgi:hypothetical protein
MSRTPIHINFPAAQRVNASDPKLYSFANVASLDQSGEDYILHLTIRAADTDTERYLADTCTRSITAAPQVSHALEMAYAALDSVAFLKVEGDSDQVKRLIADALSSLRVERCPATGMSTSIINRTRIEEVKIGDSLEVDLPTGKVSATVELIQEGQVTRTLCLCSGGATFELIVERGMSVSVIG